MKAWFPAAIHLATPFGLHWMASGKARRLRLDVSSLQRKYDVITVGIATLTLATRVRATRGRPSVTAAGAFLGIALPAAALIASSRQSLSIQTYRTARDATLATLTRAPSNPALRMTGSIWTVVVAASEEVIWRGPIVAPLAGHALYKGGARRILTTSAFSAISVTGFALVHVPGGGIRSLPYMGTVAVVATALGHTGGVAAAASFHAAHNLAIDLITAVRKTARVYDAPRLSSTAEDHVMVRPSQGVW